ADTLVQEEAEQMPHRRQPSRHAGGLEATGVEVGEVVPQQVRPGNREVLSLAAEKLGKIREVAAIGVERVVARTLFRREHVEEQVDQCLVFGRLAGTHCPDIPANEMPLPEFVSHTNQTIAAIS